MIVYFEAFYEGDARKCVKLSAFGGDMKLDCCKFAYIDHYSLLFIYFISFIYRHKFIHF